jgi:methyltransferase
VLTPSGRLALTAGLAAQRLVELRWSARNLRRAGPGQRASARTYPLMVGVNIALFATSALRRHRPAPAPAVEMSALAGLAGAVGLRLWVIRTLGDAWNVQAHVAPTTAVVTRGPYRWVRHPNYVAVALEFACLPLAIGARGDAIVLSAANACVLWPRIRDEEALLDQVAGYREAFSGVPRFLPRRGRQSAHNPASASQSRGDRLPNPR